MLKKQKQNLINLVSKSIYLTFGGLLLSAPLFLNSCASSGKSGENITAKCQADLATAQLKYDKEEYWKIIPELEEMVNVCAGTGLVEDAQWLLANSYFAQKNYIESRGAFGAYALNFPGSPRAELALFKKAESAHNMEYRDSRDDESTTIAVRDFENFLMEFADSDLRDSALGMLETLEERRAQRDLEIAELYLKMREPLAASVYFKDIMANYPNSSYYRTSLLQLIACYIRLDQFEQAEYFLNRALTELTDDKQLAKAHDLQKDLQAAITNFKKKIEKEQKEKRYQREDQG
jgi:outer membrane assembly lipoprotein YfiO